MQYCQRATRRSGRVFLAPPVIACTGVIISLCSRSPGRKPAPAGSPAVTFESGAAAGPLGRRDRTAYPFSIVTGGVRDDAEVAAVRLADTVVRTHYSDVGPHLTPETTTRDQWLYTSYRVGASIYWTKHTVRVRAGETVLSDGVHMIRSRCGNRLSAVPNKPSRLIDPPSVLEDTPTVITDEKPPEVPFGNPGDGDAVDILVDLPGQLAPPHSHSPTVPIAPNRPTVLVARQTITGPAASVLPHRSTAASIEAPEPATWFLMLAGLGIIALAARRSRKPARS